jgi:hypothetical protein
VRDPLPSIGKVLDKRSDKKPQGSANNPVGTAINFFGDCRHQVRFGDAAEISTAIVSQLRSASHPAREYTGTGGPRTLRRRHRWREALYLGITSSTTRRF